ncbi:DoxX family protein [Corynebacterium gallinarum]|uniref:DoxX family protein n=1 Tax=Corynebacterium gallinarum TaxID=2762214 RepID=A0A8I0HQU5_9CORY|nr:DoxX family protein [Corynebacterium gallinarum]MBD8031356.1 DoxX family protein [Corynebacterium gallinarum]
MIRKIARPMLASVYIADGADTLLNTQAHVEGTEVVLDRIRYVLPRKYAKRISSDPELVAQIIGGTKVGAGSLLALGKAPRLSATTLAVVTVPTILARNAFWETQDEEEKRNRRNGFMTNVALLGGLFITSVDTQGKPGLKWRATKAASTGKKQIQQALPTKSETEKMTDKASDWFHDASDKVAEYAHVAQEYVEDNKDDWLKMAQDNAKTAKKGAVKAAGKAQERANFALKVAGETTGKAAKKANKNADKLQSRADKALSAAQKKVKKINV